MKEALEMVNDVTDLKFFMDKHFGVKYGDLIDDIVNKEVERRTQKIKNNFDILLDGYKEFRREVYMMEEHMAIATDTLAEEYDIDIDKQIKAEGMLALACKNNTIDYEVE